MQKQTKAELQMLREMAYLLLPDIACFFCKKPLIERPPDITFGHRRHPPVKVKLTAHHRNHNREDNYRYNVQPCHQVCHQLYHANDRRKLDAPIVGGGIITRPPERRSE